MALPSITWDDVLAIAPQLESTPAEERAAILDQVDAAVINQALLRQVIEAKALLAAAYATERTRFATAGAGDALDDTSYGRAYRRLLENTPGLRFMGTAVVP